MNKANITSPNRTVNASPPLAARAPKNPSRRYAPLWDFLSAKVLCARKMLRIFLIGHKKPSFTAGTLSASFLKVLE